MVEPADKPWPGGKPVRIAPGKRKVSDPGNSQRARQSPRYKMRGRSRRDRIAHFGTVITGKAKASRDRSRQPADFPVRKGKLTYKSSHRLQGALAFRSNSIDRPEQHLTVCLVRNEHL